MSEYAEWLHIGQSPYAHWVMKSDGYAACRARLESRRTFSPDGLPKCPRCKVIERDAAGGRPNVAPMAPKGPRRNVAYRLPIAQVIWIEETAARRACSQQQVVEDAIRSAMVGR